jgi:nicotinamide mononucleotide transporter
LLSGREKVAGVLIALLGSFLLYQLLLHTPGASNPLPDALLTGFSLLAQFWLARRKLENWLLWMGINVGSVILYFQRELWFFAALYFLLLLLAFRGYGSWKKTLDAC